MKKYKIAVAIVIALALGYFSYSYYKLNQMVKLHQAIFYSLASTTPSGFTGFELSVLGAIGHYQQVIQQHGK